MHTLGVAMGELWLHGRMIEPKKVRNEPQYAGNLVPASWELVCQAPGRPLQVVAGHVAAFDVADDGSIVYTNGYDVTHWREGQASAIGRHELVEAVAVRR